MKLAPLILWRRETAKRAPNVIEDLDEFERNMACVSFDANLYSTGVVFRWNRYSCEEMGAIISEFERGTYIQKGDVTPQQPRRKGNWKSKLLANAKIKYDPDDIGRIHIWIPFGDKKRWVTLDCTNPDLRGMPLWLHEKAMELAKVEADAFCSVEDQRIFRARLFDMVADTSSKSSAKRRRQLARAIQNPGVKNLLRRHVEMAPEDHQDSDPYQYCRMDDQESDHPFAPDDAVEQAGLAGASREDAMQLTPRPSPKRTSPPKTWAQMQREKQRGTPARQRKDEAPEKTKPRRTTGKPRRSGLNLTWKQVS